jgi:hypothetical protein
MASRRPRRASGYTSQLDLSIVAGQGVEASNQSKQSQQHSTTSGGSTSAQIVGDGNTVNIQPRHVDPGGTVVAVYMQGSALASFDLRRPTSDRPLTVAHVLGVHVEPGETIQPGRHSSRLMSAPSCTYGITCRPLWLASSSRSMSLRATECRRATSS